MTRYAGGCQCGAVRFRAVDYGAPVMRRHVVRALTEPLPTPDPTYRPRHLLLVGEGPRARLLTTRLRARGVQVLTVPDAGVAQAALREHPDLDALGLVLTPPAPPKVSELRPDAAREAGAAWVRQEASHAKMAESTANLLQGMLPTRGPAQILT